MSSDSSPTQSVNPLPLGPHLPPPPPDNNMPAEDSGYWSAAQASSDSEHSSSEDGSDHGHPDPQSNFATLQAYWDLPPHSMSLFGEWLTYPGFPIWDEVLDYVTHRCPRFIKHFKLMKGPEGVKVQGISLVHKVMSALWGTICRDNVADYTDHFMHYIPIPEDGDNTAPDDGDDAGPDDGNNTVPDNSLHSAPDTDDAATEPVDDDNVDADDDAGSVADGLSDDEDIAVRREMQFIDLSQGVRQIVPGTTVLDNMGRCVVLQERERRATPTSEGISANIPIWRTVTETSSAERAEHVLQKTQDQIFVKVNGTSEGYDLVPHFVLDITEFPCDASANPRLRSSAQNKESTHPAEHTKPAESELTCQACFGLRDFGWSYDGCVIQGRIEVVLYAFSSIQDFDLLSQGVKENRDPQWFIDRGLAAPRVYLLFLHHPLVAVLHKEAIFNDFSQALEDVADLKKHPIHIPWDRIISILRNAAKSDAETRLHQENPPLGISINAATSTLLLRIRGITPHADSHS
ncbi:uncharacterized protein C8Q71DRAFT_898228 [Rhodofomes roseus]|uniref:Uncharacterized protein n=1 Tax=Rhodofomes roseus TaxID=34475 RepID=A0ABQ8KIY7_9APHY|nr:uncharacterized protein C8Q71DRAFT_898228 [Rhodofomes roseus]KAH9837762.1 hypothetical protein C8Q71DRAFT_898228 [Rhodofomes roseus]